MTVRDSVLPLPNASALSDSSAGSSDAGVAVTPGPVPGAPARRVARWLRGGLPIALITSVLVACGGGGSADNGGGGGGGVTPAPVPSPLPPTPMVIPANCAEPGTGAGPVAGSEAPTQIGSNIDAYANCNSVYAGQTITFHLSDHAGSAAADRNADVTIVRVGESDETVYTGSATMRKQAVPNDAWINCCNWPTGLALTVPTDWQSGYYRAQFSSPSGGSSFLSFVVKNRTPGTVSNVVLQVPFDTSQMYNGWGGKSAYTFNSTGGDKAEEVSMLRPSLDAVQENYIPGVVAFIRWADSRGIAMEFISSTEMHADANALTPYKVFITVGHDEYWTQAMRDQLDSHLDAGNHAAIFSGNTMWWRTQRVTDDYGQALGKLIGNRQTGTETANWFEFDPEARTIGVSFFKGGFVNQNTQPGLINQPYVVYRPNHWAFNGTGLGLTSQFGADDQIHRYESDGIDFTFVGGLPEPTGGDGAPTNTTILAVADLPGWDSPSDTFGVVPNISLTGTGGPNAAITTFTRPSGGIVFNAGTTDFYQSLPSCTGAAAVQKEVCKITSNVISHLKAN